MTDSFPKLRSCRRKVWVPVSHHHGGGQWVPRQHLVVSAEWYSTTDSLLQGRTSHKLGDGQLISWVSIPTNGDSHTLMSCLEMAARTGFPSHKVVEDRFWGVWIFARWQWKDSPFLCLLFLAFTTVSSLPQINLMCVCVCVCTCMCVRGACMQACMCMSIYIGWIGGVMMSDDKFVYL